MDDEVNEYGCNRCKKNFYTAEEIEASKRASDILDKIINAHYCDECFAIVLKDKKEKEDRQYKLESIHNDLSAFLIPKFIKLGEKDLDPKKSPVGDFMRFLIQDESWCFYLFGAYGSGKTHLAYWVLLRAIKKGVFYKAQKHQDGFNRPASIAAVEAGEIISLYQAQYRKKDGDSEFAIEKFYKVGVLFIDDLGAERDTDDSRRIMEDLLCYRYNNQLKTIITANVPIEDMASRYSGRLASRLGAGESSVLIHEDRRCK